LSSHLEQQLSALAGADGAEILRNINRGIEKEALRITPDGKLADTPHPVGLGSALTHSSITTDYSEALMEFITPVSNSIEGSLQTLENVHSFVYQNLDNEMLWTASMPCIVTGDDGIPVAQYGSSNVARMKKVYRYGLGHRYGRLMQAIAGIHYNFSMPQAYWEHCWTEAGQTGELSDYISERYLGLIRNFRRFSWLLIYLYGASPAVCASFLRGRQDHALQPFDEQGKSMHLPHGTALRMGNLGYNSEAQKNLQICYNSLDNYIDTLHQAILQPHAEYSGIKSGQDGDYQQLNDSLLQIENEFYSPIRPKRVTRSGETPLNALKNSGIEYIEVRCIDISPFCPAGLDEEQVRFLDTFLLYCLLEDSPPCDDQEQLLMTANMETVVNRGRQPGLKLESRAGEVSFNDWAGSLLDSMQGIAKLLDRAAGSTEYAASLAAQAAKVRDPELTPSARILREMRERDLPFFRLAMAYSENWARYYRERALPADIADRFRAESRHSLDTQREIEAADNISFEQYLANFYQQYEAL
jgi:glutamate--cysteine ligase